MIELVKTTGKVDLSLAQDYKAGYEAGKGAGYLDGYYNGRAEGVEARDLEWWNNYLNRGTTWASYKFAGGGWTKETFTPPKGSVLLPKAQGSYYNINSMFQSHNQDAPIYDLVEHLEELKVILDFSQCSAMVNTFNGANVSRIGVIDITQLTGSYNSSSVFSSPYIETIDKVIMKERTFDYYGNEFNGATALKNITIEGVIANNKLNFSACPLTHDSLMSIINHLKDFSGTTTRSITFGAANLAKLTDAEKAIATEKGWSLA